MELLYQNLINTTTQLAVGSNSDIVSNLFNPDKFLQYFTDGFNSDATTASLTVTFDSTQTVDRIALLEHNLESFNIFYNGLTANSIALSGPTTVANFISNTAEDTYLQLSAPIFCTSLTLDMRTTIDANAEKAIGFMLLSSVRLDFSRIPNSTGYVPTIEPKQIVHQMSDGGSRVHTVRQKWHARLKLSLITEAFRNQLRDIYDAQDANVFVPFGTGTSWDGILFEAVWIGSFDFYRYGQDAATAGFNGSIDLRETSG
jgi:hypothetical protein